MPSKDKYTDPELRDEVKEELHKSDKGGAPGQWSARKAQMMASEYKKRGGDYNTDKSEKDESQKNLENWGKEDWQTKEGSGTAKQKDGSQKRYLPKKAWENMSEKEKKGTDDKKQSESKRGKQHVGNTDKAKNSRKKATQKEEEDIEQSDAAEEEDDREFQPDEEEEKRDDDENKEGDTEENEVEQSDSNQDEEEDDDDEEFQPEKEENDDDDDDDDKENDDDSQKNKSNKKDDQDAKAGQKRGRSTQDESSSKKQKSDSDEPKSKKTTVGSKHMDAKEPGKRGSADRLPKKNQKVHWKALPGYVAGKLVEILTKDKQVDGKSYKASDKDPRLVLKSDASGKICVHKAETCFYD